MIQHTGTKSLTQLVRVTGIYIGVPRFQPGFMIKRSSRSCRRQEFTKSNAVEWFSEKSAYCVGVNL